MEAIRRIVESKNNSITIDIPKEFTSKKFEVIILPFDDIKKTALEEYTLLIKDNPAFASLNDPEEDIYNINDYKK